MEHFDLVIDYLQIGDLGANRDKFLKKVNQQAGKGNWFWAFRCKGKLYSWDFGMQLYEDAYWNLMRSDIDIVKNLIGNFNVYVWDRHDLESVFDYRFQKNIRDHYSDIAIRRCFVRLGVWFQGKDLFDLKSTDLDSSNVPFHLPHLIEGSDKSARSWIQKNRFIVIATETEDKCKLSGIMVK